MNDYVIAVPSYKRAETLKKKTLATLEFNNIPLDKVHVFVANEEEREEYEKALNEVDFPGQIIVAEPTLKNARNFITRYFPVGTYIFNLDDDVKNFRLMVRDSKGRTLDPKFSIPETTVYDGPTYSYYNKATTLDEHIQEGFRLCEEEGTALFGFYPTTNSIGMSCTYTTKITYIIGAAWGCINPGDIFITVPDDKEDYERSIMYYDRYKKVVRMNWLAPETNYYDEQGGMQEERTDDRVVKCAKYLEEKYPQYCKTFWKKSSKGEKMELKLFDKPEIAKTPKLF